MKTLVKYFLCFTLALVMHSVAIAQLHHRDKPLPCLNKTFYIHVHVVLNKERDAGNVTRGHLDSILAEASEYFKPICANFTTCDYDTIQDYNYANISPGGRKTREMIAKFQEYNRINLYLVNGILFQCGYTRFESINDPKSAAVFVSKYSCLNSKVLAQELGHLFGLLHTYHDRYSELVNGSNCETAGDKICDTPADPYVPGDTLRAYVKNCEFIHTHPDPNRQHYQPLVGNIMSGYNCPCGFTYDQLERMANNYLNSTEKIW